MENPMGLEDGRERRRQMAPATMVGWFNPSKILKTGVETVISTVFGKHADRRLLEPFTLHANQIYDYSQDESGKPRRELTLDYVADTGDGWNATYAVLYWMSRATLAFDGRSTQRGEILVMGGDQVYPTANRNAYEQRLLKPMEAAMAHSDAPHPHLYAIPGNHDWYDSLVSFTRLFMANRWIAGWKTRQSRSYFALKLPQNWWFIGTDVGLVSDIDEPQLEYMREVATKMGPQDRVLLCVAEPFWVTEGEYVRKDINLKTLERVFGDRIRIYLAGDLHHYRRHESSDKRQKITAGGGGAFVHPTHGWSAEPLQGYKLCKDMFPSLSDSRRLTYQNLLFPILNWRFGLITAVLYTMIGWSMVADIGAYPINLDQFMPAATATVKSALSSPLAATWIALVLAGFVFFTETSGQWYRRIAGPVHGLVHLGAVFIIGWLGARVATFADKSYGDILYSLIVGAVFLAGGFIAGPFLMGLYLLISLNVFGRHRNESFSAIKSQDWKHFLRFMIDSSGQMTIFPIGIRRVPRKWKETGDMDPRNAAWIPDDPAATSPQLIEQPVVVK
jgi:hypothetical protein